MQVFDDYLSDCTSSKLLSTAIQCDCWTYNNFFEKKQVVKDVPIDMLPFFQDNTHKNFASKVTGIENLEHDPFLHGSGLHIMRNGDYLKTHLDYSLHPKMHKERRVNVVVFLNDWDPSWGGSFCFYPHGPSGPATKVSPKKNRAIIFETTDTAWHAVEPLTCPVNVVRATVAIFYVTQPRANMIIRHKAQFAYSNDEEKRMSDIRSTRLLDENDLIGNNVS